MQLKLLIYINGFKLKIDDTLNSKTRISKKMTYKYAIRPEQKLMYSILKYFKFQNYTYTNLLAKKYSSKLRLKSISNK